MVRNKTELLNAYNEWMGVAVQDLRKHIGAFMERTNADVNTLANILEEDPNVLQALLTGQATTIPMSLFGKLLIATGHVICIMPEGQMPQGGHMRPPQQQMRPQRPNFGPHPMHMCPPMTPPMGTMPYGLRHPEDPARQPMTPPMGAPFGGYPRPNPNGQLPNPEDMPLTEEDIRRMVQEQMGGNAPQPQVAPTPFGPENFGVADAPIAPCVCGVERPVETQDNANREQTNVNNGTTVDPIANLAQALRANPQVSELLRSLLNQ